MSLMTAPLCLKAASKGPLHFDFALQRFEASFDWIGGPTRLDRSHHFGLFWIEQGSGELQVDQSRVPLAPGSFIFISPGQLNEWKIVSPVRGEIALFTEEFLTLSSVGPGPLAKMACLYESCGHSSLRLEGNSAEGMARMFAELRREVECAEIGQDDQVRARMTLILGQARRLFASQGSRPDQSAHSLLAWRFRTALAQHFPRLSLAGQYVELLQVSRRQLNDELRRHYGRTASELIHERTVLEAKRLLMHTGLTISEIGFELRFEDPSYFVRFFRRLTGTTPGQYRASATTGGDP